MSNPIQVKRNDVVAAIRALAEYTGLSLTDTIAIAVQRQLAIEREKAEAMGTDRRRESLEALSALRALPIVGPELTDEDLYDSEGMPK